MAFNNSIMFSKSFDYFFSEDEISKNFKYLNSLPEDIVECKLKLKDDLILSGLPIFFEAFNYLQQDKSDFKELHLFEGQEFFKNDKSEISFKLPFNIALTGERIALNLLQRSSSISTFTNKFVKKAKPLDIKILDTRKTTPGLRFLEKYAVNIGGGHNHRFGQTDAWMIKDNHKSFFGGVDKAINYFKSLNSFYNPLIVEIHDLAELEIAFEHGAKHFLLDNFSPDEIKKAIKLKKEEMSYEISGGITVDNIDSYLIKGVDAISSGSITYNAPQVDLSLKFGGL